MPGPGADEGKEAKSQKLFVVRRATTLCERKALDGINKRNFGNGFPRQGAMTRIRGGA